MESSDYFLSLNLPLKFFKAFGLWQSKGTKTPYKVYGVVLHLIGVDMFLLAQLLHLLHVDNITEASDLLSVLFTYVMLCFKTLSVFYKLEEIIHLIEDLKDLISLSASGGGRSLEKFKAREKQTNKIFQMYWGSCLMATLLGGLVPIITYLGNPYPPYKVAYKISAPIEYEQNIFWFMCVSMYQWIDSLCFCGLMVAADMLPVCFLNAGWGLLEELSERIERILLENETSEDSLKKVQKCIEIHLKLRRFIKNSQKIFSMMILAQGSTSLIILCTNTFVLSTVSNNVQLKIIIIESWQISQQISPLRKLSVFIRLASYMIPMVLQIFIPSYFGNEISFISNELSMRLFHCNWLTTDGKFRAALKIFMENTKPPMEVSVAGGVFQVNLQTFLRVCNSAYSVYALLKNIN